MSAAQKHFIHLARVAPLDGTGPHHPTFRFYLRKTSEITPDSRWDNNIEWSVSVKKLPAFLNKLADNRYLDSSGLIGIIEYRIKTGTATTYDYKPKECAPDAAGAGYFLELLATQYMREVKLADKVKTSFWPSKARKAQLGKAILPIRSAVPIDGWIAGLERALRKTVGSWKETA